LTANFNNKNAIRSLIKKMLNGGTKRSRASSPTTSKRARSRV
jgi:hypothetical protein